MTFDYERYIYLGDGDRVRKRRLVKFEHIEVDKDQYRFKVDSVHMPRGRGVTEGAMAHNDVVSALSYTISKPVKVHAKPGFGFWFLVDREHGLGNVPLRVNFDDLIHAVAGHKLKMLSVPIGLGAGRDPIVIDFGKETTAHFAVGGTTGGGKSSMLHVIICTLIQNSSPNELKLSLFDFKRAEFIPFYSKLPHLLHPIIFDPHAFAEQIGELSKEVDSRYTMMMNAKVTSITKYNQSVPKPQRMPYIIVFIDETSRVMLDSTIPKDQKAQSTAAMANIASLGRACGVHLILATQRPDAKTLPGLVRACMPGKIAFACASMDESKIIIGNTDAYFKDKVPPGRAILSFGRFRLPFQSAWLDEAQRRAIVDSVMDGKTQAMRMTHDVDMQELARYAMQNWDGKFKQRALFDHFKDRGITWSEVRSLASMYLENHFNLDGKTYILVRIGKPPAPFVIKPVD